MPSNTQTRANYRLFDPLQLTVERSELMTQPHSTTWPPSFSTSSTVTLSVLPYFRKQPTTKTSNTCEFRLAKASSSTMHRHSRTDATRSSMITTRPPSVMAS
jgi:hypothetical protein